MPSPRLTVLSFCVAGLAWGAAAAADPVAASKPEGWKPRRAAVEAPKPRTPPAELIARLRSPRFVERAGATRELARSGLPAVSPLREAATAGDPEVSMRAVAALENLWLEALESGDDATADAALAALDELSVAGDAGLRARVEALLASYEPLIEKFAVNEIRRLGGSVRFDPSQSRIDDSGMAHPLIVYVVIGSAWKGGEAGLRHVRRAQPRNAVYFIRGADLPEGAAARFEVASGVRAETRGPSYLGVQSQAVLAPGVEGCLVDTAGADTPAGKAGIVQGDLIVGFNGRRITHFDQLVKEIEQTRPGQTVECVVRRIEPDADGRGQAALKTLNVTMEEWR